MGRAFITVDMEQMSKSYLPFYRSDDPYFMTHIKHSREGMVYWWMVYIRWLDVETNEVHIEPMYEDLSDNLREFLARWVDMYGFDNYAASLVKKIEGERK